MHYAKSIKILNTLTSGVSYIQPPVIVIEYGELTLTDIGKGTLVDVTFETDYRINLDDHIRAIWIAIGVLSGLGLIFAFAETLVWHGRAGKQTFDLAVSKKHKRFFLYILYLIDLFFFVIDDW